MLLHLSPPRLYDAHVHLADAEYSGYLGHILESMRAMNLVGCSVAVDIATSLKGIEIFAGYVDIVRQFVGIHPEFAAQGDPDKLAEVFRANASAISGIGEIGLDGTYEQERGVPYSRQKQVFEAMLSLAESVGKPVSIHSRRALDDVLGMLPSFRIRGALLHWFAGSKKQLARSMDLDGVYVSYGPTLVYADDKKVLLKNTLRDRFLVETDGPVRYARCFEGRPALPTSCLASVVAAAAATLGIEFGEAAALLQENTEAFLGGQARL